MPTEPNNHGFDLGTHFSLCCSTQSRVAKSISGEYYPKASLLILEKELHEEEQHVCTASVSFRLAAADCKAAKLEGYLFCYLLSITQSKRIHLSTQVHGIYLCKEVISS